ncbi:MAG: Rrf2 family transcriptional regulator [Candidatus Omnitrophica bacterium]|nr:Rrf2 family transcriptional regulator [Candidatus Omnitrophota bacterium]
MNFISRDTDYAVRALIFMAGVSKKEIITVDEIVKKERLPERFLRRILQRLAKSGILTSHKGKKGGFSFFVPPAAIRLTDIMEIFQGKIDLTNCLLKSKVCPNVKKCPLRKKLKNLGQGLDTELKKITIVSLSKER